MKISEEREGSLPRAGKKGAGKGGGKAAGAREGGFGKNSPGQAGDKLLEYVFPARPEQLCGLRESLRASLKCCCTSEDTLACMILAVSEACMNVMQHAYGGDVSGDIIVEAWRREGSLVFRITDFAEHKSCAEEMKSRPLDDIRPGGLGCHLINEIMDEVTLIDCANSCGNVLQMKKTLED